jgi:hypothetical protein
MPYGGNARLNAPGSGGFRSTDGYEAAHGALG